MDELTKRMHEMAENLKPQSERAAIELFKSLKSVIEDLELRAKIHKTRTDDDFVVQISDGVYQKAKDVIAKYEVSY